MPFIGPKPADTVLDSTLIADGTITSAKAEVSSTLQMVQLLMLI